MIFDTSHMTSYIGGSRMSLKQIAYYAESMNRYHTVQTVLNQKLKLSGCSSEHGGKNFLSIFKTERFRGQCRLIICFYIRIVKIFEDGFIQSSCLYAVLEQLNVSISSGFISFISFISQIMIL